MGSEYPHPKSASANVDSIVKICKISVLASVIVRNTLTLQICDVFISSSKTQTSAVATAAITVSLLCLLYLKAKHLHRYEKKVFFGTLKSKKS